MHIFTIINKIRTLILIRLTKNINKIYPQYEIGRGTYGNPMVYSWNEEANLKIGAFCSIANGVKIILGGEHRTDWVTTYPFSHLWKQGIGFKGHPRTKGDVIIGNDVWIGLDSIIMSGVNIGDGAVIGARSLVTKDVKPYSIVAGNPAELIRKRFDDNAVNHLLKIKWWEWEDSTIEKMLPLILQSDINKFIKSAWQIK